MSKWCNYFNCWCNDVEEVIPEEGINCNLECRNCENMEEIKPER
ncbi:MAG TPA: hypothetical protein OIM49_05950 [Clostridiaceae bacterium]|jgi:hypothetical protein|nr:hypothetical protein [Clostridiaceae bacterium]